jgi:hypothetical protein
VAFGRDRRITSDQNALAVLQGHLDELLVVFVPRVVENFDVLHMPAADVDKVRRNALAVHISNDQIACPVEHPIAVVRKAGLATRSAFRVKSLTVTPLSGALSSQPMKTMPADPA